MRWLNNSFTLNFEMAYLPLNWCCVFHKLSHLKFILPVYRNGVIKYWLYILLYSYTFGWWRIFQKVYITGITVFSHHKKRANNGCVAGYYFHHPQLPKESGVVKRLINYLFVVINTHPTPYFLQYSCHMFPFRGCHI